MNITEAQIREYAAAMNRVDPTGIEGWIEYTRRAVADTTRPFFLKEGGLADVQGGIGSVFKDDRGLEFTVIEGRRYVGTHEIVRHE